MSVGIKIKRLRESKKISQNELSIILGISQSKLCTIESSADKSIDINLVKKICNYFGVGFDYFLDEENTLNKSNNEINKKDFNPLNNSSENILEQIKSIIEDNKKKESKITELEKEIIDLKKPDKKP